jgi:hypothetical protein
MIFSSVQIATIYIVRCAMHTPCNLPEEEKVAGRILIAEILTSGLEIELSDDRTRMPFYTTYYYADWCCTTLRISHRLV